MLKFDSETGTLNTEKTPFTNGVVHFHAGNFTVRSTELKWVSEGNSFKSEFLACKFSIYNAGGAVYFELQNDSDRDIFVKDTALIFSPSKMTRKLAAEEWMEYVCPLNFSAGSVKKVGLKNDFLKHNPESSVAYVLFKRDTGESYISSILPPHNGDYTTFKALHDSAHLEGCFGLKITSDQKAVIKPGKSLKTTAIQIEKGSDPLELLSSLGDKWLESKELPLKDSKIGWNSWDYFSGAVRPEDIYKNRDAVKKHLGEEIKYFVIDEGYEPRWGVWDANWKFSEGLKAFCEKITSTGGIPGIWTSPLLVNSYTNLYRENPDWFALGADGEVATKRFAYGPMAFLDITHPEVEQFISDIYSRLREYGFRYFKVDFCQEVLNADIFHDRTVQRGNIIRKAFETIRNAIGDENYLLACGAPYESVLGTVDACRTTGDIHNFWGHVLHNASSMSTTWWMHRKFWNNDPDFFIVRCAETCDLPLLNRKYQSRPFDVESIWLGGREFNLKEVKAYAQLVYLSAGDIFLSDDLTALNQTGFDIIRKVIERPLSKAAVPVDLFKSHSKLPEVWIAREDGFTFVGLFNWGEDPEIVAVDLAGLGAGNAEKPELFWGDEKVVYKNGAVAVELEPRSCGGLIFR